MQTWFRMMVSSKYVHIKNLCQVPLAHLDEGLGAARTLVNEHLVQSLGHAPLHQLQQREKERD
uniref:Uncharacterized protein n=1 Tax=Pristionchus pacificus TaxID=54126 RepID=A0A2A6CX92_PRIPA|eukprot:PDM82706.1 hypothetical protein PRIPAC_37099 [Pristionchus pacificus]